MARFCSLLITYILLSSTAFAQLEVNWRCDQGKIHESRRSSDRCVWYEKIPNGTLNRMERRYCNAVWDTKPAARPHRSDPGDHSNHSHKAWYCITNQDPKYDHSKHEHEGIFCQLNRPILEEISPISASAETVGSASGHTEHTPQSKEMLIVNGYANQDLPIWYRDNNGKIINDTIPKGSSIIRTIIPDKKYIKAKPILIDEVTRAEYPDTEYEIEIDEVEVVIKPKTFSFSNPPE